MTKRKASVALETGNESNQSSTTQENNNSNSTSITSGTSNNNSTNHNGSSNGGANGCRQQIANSNQNDNGNSNSSNNGGNQAKNKKERADNWSSAEIQVLHRGIETRRDIFYGPPSQATKKNRELAWEAITKEVNSVSTTPRSLGQVMKKFKNEKCRAKRKFIDSDKDGHNNLGSNTNANSSNNSNNNTSASTTNTTANNTNDTNNLSAQNHTNNNTNNQHHHQTIQSQQQQSHHMTNTDSMSTSQPSINVVKLAPQNVAKTMIDLPGHVQQIQMPNEEVVTLIVPPEMDGILSGMNIVSDVNGHHHFQKCSSSSSTYLVCCTAQSLAIMVRACY